MTSLLTKEDVERFIYGNLVSGYDKSKLTANALHKIISLDTSWNKIQNKLPSFYYGEQKRYDLKKVCRWLSANQIKYFIKIKENIQ